MSAATVLPLHAADTAPPYSDEAEQAVLGAMLMDADAVAFATSSVREAQFYGERHRRIFRAMVAIADGSRAIDPITLSEELSRKGELEAAGGKDYIGYLVDVIPTAANIEYHAGIVREKYEAREASPQLAHAAELVRAGKSLNVVRRQLDGALDVIAPPVSRTALCLYDDVEIERLPDAVPIIAGTAYEDSIVVVVGAYATLKTFFLLDVALCLGTGRPWHGRAVRQGAVVYIYAEGRSGIKKRVRAWKQANGHDGPANVYFLPMSVRLTEPAEVSRLLRLVEQKVVGSLAAVFVDTIARNMGGDENKVEDMNRFVAGCDRIREETGATIFAAHHTGWAAERSRGSTSLPGAINTELRIERDDMLLTVTCTKQKDGIEEDANITLEAYPLAGSLALRDVVPNRADLTRNERHALSTLQATDGLTFGEWKEATGLQPSSLNNARSRLLRLAYVNLAKRKYVSSEAGKIALSTNSNGTTRALQAREATVVQHALSPIGESVVLSPLSSGMSGV